MEDDEIGVLKFQTEDIEPDPVKPIKVILGDQEYLARCPNAYEFMDIWRQVKDIKLGDAAFSLDIPKIISAFFTPMNAREIDVRTRGAEPEIQFGELVGAIFALVDHYDTKLKFKAKEANRATRRAKKAPTRR